jgi:nucleoside-diphosphate-sugar epimerase
MIRIFVAGATGTVGRRVVPQLVEGGHEVTAVGRTAEKRQALERVGTRTVATDRKLRGVSGWAPRYRSALDGFEAVIKAGASASPTR